MREDEELVAKLRAGDETAFAVLVRAHHAALVRLATAIVGSRALADEVVQDTWLAVVRGVESFEGRSSLRTWLFRILVNRARTTAGKERRSDPLGDIDSDRFDATGVWAAPPVPWADQVDDRLVAEQLAPLARTAIDTLPDVQRQVLLLRDVEGLPAADVADLLGLTDGNQRVLLHRARARVRSQLEAKLGRT
ncbi:MAG: sigma-70 family RNA polymerase sigma factor [Actinomycetota bacterium]